jgi:hypothetical protein
VVVQFLCEHTQGGKTKKGVVDATAVLPVCVVQEEKKKKEEEEAKKKKEEDDDEYDTEDVGIERPAYLART